MMIKGSPNVSRSATARTRASRQRTVSVSAANALIVNCKSGGHAFIGYYLANELLAKGHSVTILNDGEEVRLNLIYRCWLTRAGCNTIGDWLIVLLPNYL